MINKFSAVVCPRGTFSIFTILFTTCRLTNSVGQRDEQTDVGLLYVYTDTHTHELSYLILACNNVYTVLIRSAFACLTLEIGKQRFHSDGSIQFWSLKREKTILYGKSREKMLLY